MGLVSKMLQRIQGAQGEVSRLEETAARWEAEAATKRAELADLEARMGDEVLADESAADRLTSAASALRARITVAEQTARAAQRRLRTARGDVSRAKAAESREKATAAQRTADAHQGKVDALLAQLRQVDGVDYCWVQPELGPPGHGAPLSYDVPLGFGFQQAVDDLAHEAAQHDADAVAHEEGRPPRPAQRAEHAIVHSYT